MFFEKGELLELNNEVDSEARLCLPFKSKRQEIKRNEQAFWYKKDERMYSLHQSWEGTANTMWRQIPFCYYWVLAAGSAFCEINKSYFVCEMVSG